MNELTDEEKQEIYRRKRLERVASLPRRPDHLPGAGNVIGGHDSPLLKENGGEV